MDKHENRMDAVYQMLKFIEESPTCFHAVENVQEQLKKEGYLPINENEEWKLSTGGKYYVNRNGSALIAFRLPEKEIKGFHMVASHSDSPCFKIKEIPEMAVEEQYVKLNVEPYGGMIMSTWMDRPLSVAGRVVVTENGSLVSRTVTVDRDLLIIPNMAIHMNRDINKGMEYNAQTDMLPLYGGIDSRNSFLSLIAGAAGVKAEDVLSSDLFLYNREAGRILGAEGEFVSAPRLDDLECVYASMRAMLASKSEENVNLMIVFDNEEVGSMTRQGAASTFLQDTLLRICESLSLTKSGYCRMLADSFMISADNAHGVHPNHPEKADPTNRPYLNGGIVIKYHGSQKYTTDAVSAAVMKDICKRAEVPFQTYANRSDIAGGSTLGNISAAQVPVSTVDIGLAQLAMHSAYETAGSLDVEAMIKALSCFYSM
ncbi:aspartyl aminopeptidase [Kineothrix alysoides]|uniref:M18 family aminopeptidase n=1 Tax=Kineothrix alysoides TaxID=1469948 RepID=A0A4R1QMT5_9FIRM|nr:M18 family aminopeptidase [Kineothrix alysoides]TCL54986.1 aspartyl aminopeptidase [Kineothrix alysoides]